MTEKWRGRDQQQEKVDCILMNMFMLQEHLNFICDDEKLGPVILSVKQEIEKLDGCDTQGFIRVILRYCLDWLSFFRL